MRIINIAKELNIAVDRVLEFLISQGYDDAISAYSKISEHQKRLLLIEFQEDYKFKAILIDKKIEGSDVSNSKDDYSFYKEMYLQQFQKFSLKRKVLLNEIEILSNINIKETAIEDVIVRKKKEIEELILQNKIAIEQFEPNILYTHSDDENIMPSDEDFEIDYEDYEVEKDVVHIMDSGNDDSEWSHYTSDNPWRDVFGDGDEAETAYWNTD